MTCRSDFGSRSGLGTDSSIEEGAAVIWLADASCALFGWTQTGQFLNMAPTITLARRFWMAIEPIHAISYFAPEPAEAAKRIGLRGFWMGYFAGRVAPLGVVPASAVCAMAYGFAPSMVSRAIPDAWRFASPELILQTRIESSATALRTHIKPEMVNVVAELSQYLWDAVQGCGCVARNDDLARAQGRRTRPGWRCRWATWNRRNTDVGRDGRHYS